MHVARRQQIRDVGRPAPSADLLVVAERQVHGAPGLGARRDEVLHRLENSDQAHLVVQRSPAPHVASGDPPLERGLGPAALCSWLHRDHVLMRQEDDRWKVRVGPRPLVQQAVAVHLLEFERGMEAGEGRPQVAMEAVELTSVELARVLIGDGLEAQGARQTLREGRGVERLDCHWRRLGLARAEREGALERHGGEHQQHEEEAPENLFHGARRWRDEARPARGPAGRPSDYTLCVIAPFAYGEVRYFRMARTVLGRAVYWTGVYLVDGLLVDSGPPNLARDVRRLVGELGVRQCVTTHHHEDHSGNHGLLARELHITPLAHRSGVARLAESDAQPPLYRRVAWGARPPVSVAPLAQQLETPQFRFQVIHTPGHAADHVALFEPERGWLFSGDLYLAPRLRYLRADEDVYAMMDSLRRGPGRAAPGVFFLHPRRGVRGAAPRRAQTPLPVGLGRRGPQQPRRRRGGA